MEDDAIDQRETMEDSTNTRLIKEDKAADHGSNGGLINRLKSTIIPTEKGATTDSESTEQEEEQGSKGSGGGIMENLISNLTSPRASNPIDADFFELASEDQHQSQNLQDPGGDGDGGASGGGGGLIDSIVSHLSIPDLGIVCEQRMRLQRPLRLLFSSIPSFTTNYTDDDDDTSRICGVSILVLSFHINKLYADRVSAVSARIEQGLFFFFFFIV